MNESTRTKLERIMQIQQEQNALELELARLLGDGPKEMQAPEVKKMGGRGPSKRKLSTRVGTRQRLDQRDKIKECLREMIASGASFDREAIMRTLSERMVQTTKTQVGSILRFAKARGEIEETYTAEGNAWYKKSLPKQGYAGVSNIGSNTVDAYPFVPGMSHKKL